MRSIFIFCCMLLTSFTYAQDLVHPSVSQAYEGTCAITTSLRVMGTGVLLNNGYIITAAHVVDHNGNFKIDDDEKRVVVYFQSVGRIPCELISLGDPTHADTPDFMLDVAVLQPCLQIKSTISLVSGRPPIGNPVFTIGMSLGGPPVITFGCINLSKEPGIGRAAIPIYKGNSGGGVFDKDSQQCLGLVVSVACERIIIRIGPYEGSISSPIFHLAEYVPAWRILPVINYLEDAESKRLKTQFLFELLEKIKLF